MSDYALAVERVHRAYAAMSQIQAELEKAPANRGLRLNLLGMQKLAMQAEARLNELAIEKHIDICRYRLIAERTNKFLMHHVSRSMQCYQDLFSQIYDFRKYNRKKENVGFGREVFDESALEFGYSFEGSLGMVLLAPTKRGFFEGQLDASIDTLFSIIELRDPSDVRGAASVMGNSIVKRARDWSKSNVDGGFAADVRWSKSDGRQIGQVVGLDRMERLVNIVDQTSQSETNDIYAEGRLVGGDIDSGSFHFSVPYGADYRGKFHENFDRHAELILGKSYKAKIRQVVTSYLATERTEIVNHLLHLE